jgi:hypothetical protein
MDYAQLLAFFAERQGEMLALIGELGRGRPPATTGLVWTPLPIGWPGA